MSINVYKCMQMSNIVYKCLQISKIVYKCLRMFINVYNVDIHGHGSTFRGGGGVKTLWLCMNIDFCCDGGRFFFDAVIVFQNWRET
jgi:hypothetical protein